MKQTTLTNRMTSGNEIKLLLQFMLPLLLGNIFQQIYTLVDSIVVGRFVSAVALGSVGTVSSITFLFLSLCIGLSGGVNVFVAHYFGAEDTNNVKHVIGNSIYVTAITGFGMSILAFVFATPILHLMKVPDANFADALLYMRIVCGATFVSAAYNTVSQILRALGDSRTPLYCVILSSIINVLLDLLFVVVFHWGVAGVAWATVLSQLVATLGSILIPLRKNPYFHLKKEHLKFQPSIVRHINQMGIPLAMQNAMASISGVVTQGIVNSFGSTVMSAYTASTRVEQLLAQPYGSLGVAIANFSGQNIGAAKYDRVESACKKSVLLVEGFTAGICAICFFLNKWLIGLFVTDPAITSVGSTGLIIIAISYFATGLIYIFKAMLNGAGDTVFSMVNGIIEIIARLLFLAILVSIPSIGYWGIWLTAIPSSIFAAGLCIARFRAGKWKKRLF